jgi:choline dehydrogenase-like flavoprotein
MKQQHVDVAIIGSGVGGGSVALQLAGCSASVLVIERGDYLPKEAQNGDPEALFAQQRYKTTDTWYADGRAFRPGMFYFVGGHTKFYGTAMFRFRVRDFEQVAHEEGVSPAWPIAYGDLEPWYTKAEQLFGVRGQAGMDPTEPPRSGGYGFPPVPHEPVLARIEERLPLRWQQEFHRITQQGEISHRILLSNERAISCVLGGSDRNQLFLGVCQMDESDKQNIKRLGSINYCEAPAAGAGIP